MKKSLLIYSILLFGALALGFNNCTRQVAFHGDGLTDMKSFDTEVGNPLTASAKTILQQICKAITTCHTQLSEQDCEQGVLKSPGLTLQLSAPNYPQFVDLLNAESSGALSSNQTASQVCISDLSQLSCNDVSVQNAYNPAANEPFAKVGLMVPTAPGSCPMVFTQPPQRKEYFVAASGSDSNDGSADHPWATITHADQALIPGAAGAVVHVAPGVYNLPAPATCPSGLTCMVNTTRKGTASAPIIYISDQQGQAKIQGSGTYVLWENSGEYISIIGFDIAGDKDSNFGILNSGGYSRLVGNHIHNIPVTRGCQTGDGGGGISTTIDTSAHDIEILGNLIHDIGPFPGNGLPASSYCADGEGIGYRRPVGKIQNNIIYRAAWGIMTWRAASQLQISNNLVFDSGFRDSNHKPIGGGILISADNSASPAHALSTISNNIVRNNSGFGIQEGYVGNNNIYANNLAFSNTQNLSMMSGVPIGTLFSDPLMVNFKLDGSGDYRLQPGSPLIDSGSLMCAQGSSNCTPANDFTGFARPFGTSLDIGPLEWHP